MLILLTVKLLLSINMPNETEPFNIWSPIHNGIVLLSWASQNFKGCYKHSKIGISKHCTNLFLQFTQLICLNAQLVVTGWIDHKFYFRD